MLYILAKDTLDKGWEEVSTKSEDNSPRPWRISGTRFPCLSWAILSLLLKWLKFVNKFAKSNISSCLPLCSPKGRWLSQ